jgi:hypothetical protein
MADKIEGVPEGWELVHAMRHAIAGEHYLGSDGVVRICLSERESMYAYPIIRKIENPAKYRPFASAEEFKPHRDRWWYREDKDGRWHSPPAHYSEQTHGGVDWEYRFETCFFDDGTPFGVKIDE